MESLKRLWIKGCVAALMLLAALDGRGQMRAGQIDIFMGVDFNYRDIFLNGRPFDFLVNLTPGVKWNLGNRWEVSAGALVPVINQYGKDYGAVTLNNLTVSKQMLVLKHLSLKASVGVFGGYRYGVDLKGMYAVAPWFAVKGELGCVGLIDVSSHWKMSSMTHITGLLGPVFYLQKWNTEISLLGGKYIYGDYGCEAECFRHFKHVSVGVFLSYSEVIKENGGFKVICMLPPYKRSRHKVNFRPASNFRLTYRAVADSYSNRYYLTDPEQNERQGWFDPDLDPWGVNTMAPDFVYKDSDNPQDAKAREDKPEDRGGKEGDE